MSSPTRRAALAVGVAALLVTAGCLGGTNPTETSTTPTPDTADSLAENCNYDVSTTTETATGTWSPNASVDQYPPGVADNGTLANASVLVDAHFDGTANQSMELRFESSRDDRVRTLVHGPERVPFYSTYAVTSEGERARIEFYGGDSDSFYRASLPNETLHVVYQNASPAGITAWTEYDTVGGPQNHLHPLLDGGNYSVNGTVERGDRTFVKLTTSEGPPETGHITNGTVLVTPDGVVHDVEVTVFQRVGENTPKRIDGSMTLDTDVEWCGPPSWVADVPQLELSLVEDGHAVEIRNTGGAVLPANTTLSVNGHDDPVWKPRIHPSSDRSGTVTTDDRLEPGDAVYVTASTDGNASTFALHDDPTRGEYAFGAASVTGGNERVGYRLLTGVETPEWEE